MTNLAFDDQTYPPVPGEINPETARFASQGVQAVASPTTQAGKIGTDTATPPKDKPGKRLQNPLGNFSSYTYQISLYMITPDAYNAFIQSGRKDINAIDNLSAAAEQTLFSETDRTEGSSPAADSSTLAKKINKGGAYLIAQSGGVNNSSSHRAPGFDLDFYIDNLKIIQAIGTPETNSATNITSFNFDIVEPYGFSFVSKLKRAADTLKASSSLPNYDKLTNDTRNTFILGFKFLGYDEKGNVIDPNTISSTLGNPIGNAFGIYQRYYDIIISEFKYKIDGKSVTYNIKAASLPFSTAMGLKRGMVQSGASVTGATVYDALMGGTTLTNSSAPIVPNASNNNTAQQGTPSIGLLTKLNNDEIALYNAKTIDIPSQWDVKFLGEANTTIANAVLKSDANVDKRFWPQSSVTKTAEVNPSKEKTNEQPNNVSRQITFGKGISILQAIDQIIKQSSYIADALLEQIQTTLQTDPITGLDEMQPNKNPRPIQWYNIQAEVENLGWDRKQSDFIYKTTYIIQPYITPSVLSAYAGRTDKYPGPDKRYEYWFTGNNSEVIRFEQSLDNNFFNVSLGGENNINLASGAGADIPVVVGQPQNQPKQGEINKGLEAENSYMTSLYSTDSWAKVKLQILGDPDFLMQTESSSLDSLYNLYYGTDGYTISPNGRQVFVELNFNEPVDYKNTDGLLSINQSIGITNYPAYIKEPLEKRGGGIILNIINITHTFRNGKFEQELSCNLGTFPELTTKPVAAEGRQEAASPNPNITAAVQARTGVNLSAQQPRIIQPGQTAAERAVYDAAERAVYVATTQGTASTAILTGSDTAEGAYIGFRTQKRITPITAAPKQDQTRTVPTKIGPVQDDDGGTINYNLF